LVDDGASMRATSTSKPSDRAASMLALADQCVLCGLCLPHCPTYAVSALEGRSPRGRIAHARALALDPEVPLDAVAAADLATCLSCGRCESVCPSQVQFARLLGLARETLHETFREPHLGRAMRLLARRPTWLRRLVVLARALVPARSADAARGGWRSLAAIARGIPQTALDATLPRGLQRSAAAARGRVLLLPGCVGSALDADTHAAATRVLAQLGYEVVLPAVPVCCGSLARQAGAQGEADSDAAGLRAAVRAAGASTVLSCASGCMGGLRAALAELPGVGVHDILSFIQRDADRLVARLRPLSQRLAVSVPCTQKAIDDGRALFDLLGRIPGLSLVRVPEAPGCCGAGATQSWADPATSSQLRGRRTAAILACDADAVVSSNIGCRLQLQVGLQAAGSTLPVLHPIRIIDASIAALPGTEPCATSTAPTA
jgi:glycolate oxidase iron-sulfur subunit